MRLASRLLISLVVFALSAIAATAQAATPLTDCTSSGIRAAAAAGGDYVFQCTGASDSEDDGVTVYRKHIFFPASEDEIVVDKPVSFDASDLGYEVRLVRNQKIFSDPFVAHRLFRVAQGGSLGLKGLFIEGARDTLTFAPDGYFAQDATAPGGTGENGGPAPQDVPAARDGGCMYVATGGYLSIENTTISSCWNHGVYGGAGGGGGAGAAGLSGASGANGVGGTEYGQAGEDGHDGASASPGGGGGTGADGGPAGDARGGAIFNAGTLLLTNATFSENKAEGGAGGSGGYGGYGKDGGTGGGGGNGGRGGPDEFAERDQCLIMGACGRGGDGGNAGNSGSGGNGASAGNGKAAGDGSGGAIYNTGQLTIHGAAFNSNRAVGGEGGIGGSGGVGGPAGLVVSGGGGGDGGCEPSSNCPTLRGAAGNDGNPGSSGSGGAGGSGGQGGDGFGGAIFSETPLAVDGTTVTFSSNDAAAGAGGIPGAGGGSQLGSGPSGAPGSPGTSGDPNVGLKRVEPPTADFESVQDPEKPFKVDFDASASTADPTGKIVSYSWAFGDTKAATGVKPSHTYAKPRKYDVKLTVRDSFGQDAIITKTIEVRATLKVTLKAKPAKVEVEQTKKGPKPVEIALKVTVKNPNPVAIKKIKLPEKVSISLPDEPQATRKALKQKSPPTKKVGKKDVPDLDIGTLKKGESETRTYTLVLRGDGKYVVEALVTGADPDDKTVRGVGKEEVEGSTPLLFMTAELGARVRSQKDRRLIKAGTNYLIHVKLSNRSYTKRIVVHPIYGKLDGNAADGHMQVPGRPIDYKPKGSLNEVQPSQYLEFGPRVKREYDVIVRTSASNSWLTPDEGGDGGGTRSTVAFEKPKVSIVEQGGRKITRVAPKKVLLGEDSDKLVQHIDDSAPARPEFNAWEATLYVSKGIVVGLWNVTFGTVRGLLWDLPIAAVKGLLSVPPAALDYMNHQVELWSEVDHDPVLRAQYINEVLERTAVAFENAPYMNQDKVLADLYNAVDRAVAEKYTKISREWFDGDWRGAAEAMGTEGTERFVDAATALAPAVLARMPKVAASWEATRLALYAKAGETLQAALAGLTRYRDALRALRNVVRPGLQFTNHHLTKLFGISSTEAAFIRDFVKGYRTKLGRRISIVFRSRLEESIEWLEKGAYVKPYWLKLKNVNHIDTQYLGYFPGPPAPGDVGRLVIRRPPPWEDVVDKLRANGVKPNSAEWEGVRLRHKARTKEYYKPGGDVQTMFEYNRKGEAKGKWPWQENGVATGVQKDEDVTAAFRLKRTRPGEFVVEVRPRLKNGEFAGDWNSVTGDIDLIGLTAADGTALTDEEHVDLLKALADSPFDSQHPESATWILNDEFWFKAKEDYLKNDGVCCLAEVGADGAVRAVEFDEKLSFFPKTIAALKAKHAYRIRWKGGYRAPPERSYFGVFGSLAGG